MEKEFAKKSTTKGSYPVRQARQLRNFVGLPNLDKGIGVSDMLKIIAIYHAKSALESPSSIVLTCLMEPMITVLLKENNFVRTVFEKGQGKEKR